MARFIFIGIKKTSIRTKNWYLLINISNKTSCLNKSLIPDENSSTKALNACLLHYKTGNMKKLSGIRNEYNKGSLEKEELNPNPFEQFNQWLEEAINAGCNEPTAVTLATVNNHLHPNCRIVLLKDVCDDGFVFFTNYNSEKGHELANTKCAALNFFWPELERQVRIKGTVQKVSEQKSDNYFQSRPRESQLGAWASSQSKLVENKQELITNYTALEKQYKGKSIPRPPHWGGYIVKAETIEFWQGRTNRMHDRYQFVKSDNNWIIQQLAP